MSLFRRRFRRYNRPQPKALRYLLWSGAVCLSLTLGTSSEPSDLAKIKASGILPMLTRYGPASVYEGSAGLDGFEYTLAQAFATHLDVELVVNNENNLDTLLNEVGGPKGAFAAAGLTITSARKDKVRFTSPYMSVKELVVYRNGDPKPESISDLVDKDILLIANSSHSEGMRIHQKLYPNLKWRERADMEMIDLLEAVDVGLTDYTIVDSNSYALNRSLYPQLRIAFELDQSQEISWAFAKNADDSLLKEAEKFFEKINKNGSMDAITEYYYGYVDEIDQQGAKVFAQKMDKRLPEYKNYLLTAAEMFDLDWHLLAAISYQESHWNPKARSPTGVRGFMMLTQKTAKDMGVENRLNAVDSIYGGAKYFASLTKRIDSDISEPDRTYLALAAYNVGIGHVRDAQLLTEQQGGNPHRWSDVRIRLPLLAKRKYYRHLPHGYARGWEPVKYVQNIRHFHNVLTWNTVLEQKRAIAKQQEQDNKSDYSTATNRGGNTASLSVL